tara:strand:- start:547 stop:762 length:216 start_codon:yes stop_codon:yes gene_type:complete
MKNEKAHLQTTAIKAMYSNYLEMGLDACNSFNNTPLEDELMKDFYAKESKKYQHKAEALKTVLDLLDDITY